MIQICGIVGVITKKDTDTQHLLSDLFRHAKENRHRGEDDGIGIVDLISEKTNRSIFTFKELETGKVSSEKIKVLKKKERKKDSKILKQKLDELRNTINNTKSKALILHHRKSSIGAVKLCNTHPFKVSTSVSYMHNGSIDGIYPLRNYLQYTLGYEFKSFTDSEVVSKIFEELIHSKDEDLKTPKMKYDRLIDIFWFLGELVRIDLNKKELMIIKDNTRSLYLYEYDDFFTIISEPIQELNTFNNCIRLSKGIFTISQTGFKKKYGEVKIVTKELMYFLRCSMPNLDDTKCDLCKDEKWVKRFTGNYDSSIDCCPDCYLDGSFKQEVDKRIKEKKKDEEEDKHEGINSIIEGSSVYLPEQCGLSRKDYKDLISYNPPFTGS